jgi:hypothetical protein
MQPAETLDQPRWGTVSQAAAEWGRSANTVRDWAARGLVPSRRIGKYYEVDLNALDRTRRGTDLTPVRAADTRAVFIRQRQLAETATRLRDRTTDMGAALAVWVTRDDGQDQPEARRAADAAMRAIMAMQAELRAARTRLAAEIKASDEAEAARDQEPGHGAA